MDPNMSYVVLTDSHLFPEGREELITKKSSKEKSLSRKNESGNVADGADALSQQMETTVRLFEILSARSDIDHPICSECTDLLLEGLQKRQASVIRERDAYVEFLKQAQEDIPTEEEQHKTKKDLIDARNREKKALQELEALEAAKAAMEEEIAALDAEAEQLDEEEDRFWRDRNAFTAELCAFQAERDSLQNRYTHDSKLLESLQRTNVYNDTFCIGHDGFFGTINGLRLGRLAEHPVEWSEINAAWGQAVLLLSVVAEKLNFKLQGYRLVPIGSTSKVERLEYPQTATATDPSRPAKPKVTPLELYCSGDLPLGLGLFHRNFDNAMVAFLECLRQLGEYVERSSGQQAGQGLKTPYKISKDKVGDASIKLGSFGQEESWTKACKYTLTCCKFLLAHASHVDDPSEPKTAR